MPPLVPVPPTDRWDAVVVGARAAGASTAMLLARAGLRVLLVDRARRGSDTLSTHALMRGGVLQLQRWGISDQLSAAGTPPVRRAVFHYGSDVLPVSLKPYAGVDALMAPRRTVLDAALVDAAEQAGAALRFGVSAAGVSRDPDGQVVGVVLRDRAGATWTERARLVIGADGRDSVVARSVAAPVLVLGEHAPAYAYGYFPTLGAGDAYHWHFAYGLSGGAIPTNGDLTCVFVGGPAKVLLSRLRSRAGCDGFGALLAQVDPRLAARATGDPAGRLRVFRGAPALLRQPWGPGWALVGDAGWWKDPLSTHGITDALRDAELLSDAVLTAAGPGRERDAAMAGYQAGRDRIAVAMHPVADRLASHAWSQDEVRGLLRRLSSVMADEVEAMWLAGEPVARTA